MGMGDGVWNDSGPLKGNLCQDQSAPFCCCCCSQWLLCHKSVLCLVSANGYSSSMTPTTPRPIITCCSHARSQATGLWRGETSSCQSLTATKALWWRLSSATKRQKKETWSPKCLQYFDANICPFLTLPRLSLEERSKVKKQQYGWHGSTNTTVNCQIFCLLAHPTELSHVLFVESTPSSYWPMSRNTRRGKKKNLTHQIFCIGPMKCPNRQSLIMYHYKGVKPLVLRSRQLVINERLSVTSLWSQNFCKSSCKIHVVWSQLYSLLKWRWSWQQRSSSSSPCIQTSGDSCQVHKNKLQLQEAVKWK